MTGGAVAASTRARRETLDAFYREAVGAGRAERLADFVAGDYVAHVPAFRGMPTLPPGREALRERLARAGGIRHEVARCVVDGDLAFVHVRYFDVVLVAGVDVLRFDAEGRIREHWNVRQPLPPGGRHGEDRFETSVAAEPGFAPDPAWARARLRELLTEFWAKGRADLVGEYYDESYVQHNAEMPGGFARIREVAEKDIRGYIERHGTDFPIEIHALVADGDLVAVHLSIFLAGIGRDDGARSTNVDIFRIDRRGRMTEHWDVLTIDGVRLPSDATLW